MLHAKQFLRYLQEWILDGYPLSDGTLFCSFLLEQSDIKQRLTDDKERAVKLLSAATAQ